MGAINAKYRINIFYSEKMSKYSADRYEKNSAGEWKKVVDGKWQDSVAIAVAEATDGIKNP